jgi:serine/threonine-protein kinase HipA
MGLHLVGETIDAKRAHQRAKAGELTALIRGVYVDPGDIDATVMGHAVRIARYLHPKAYLASASAVLLGPTADGKLYISGARNQRTRLRGLEIVQNEAPAHPSVVNAVVGDDLGELRVEASSPRQRFLEAFRRRSEHAAAIDDAMRAALAGRLIEQYGTPEKAADAVRALARENKWFPEAENAERYLLDRPAPRKPPPNKAALDLIVAWHRKPVGHLVHDGYEWRWQPDADCIGPPLVRATTPGRLPPFIESLLPEGWLAEVLGQRDDRDALRGGRRYLSNITIAPDAAELAALPADVLKARLKNFTHGGRFTGTYAGPERDDLEQSFEANLARIYANRQTPRLSGVQIKAPMYLGPNGKLVPANKYPFTHILKPAGTGSYIHLPVVEWCCLHLGRAAGFEVPDAALVDMPDDMSPALLVERFDIRSGASDRRRLAMEDFCSVLDLPPAAKYDGTIERMARALRLLSTDAAADLEILFQRALFAWMIADGDMHLKNLALLKIAGSRSRQFTSVRFAPLYDPVTTYVFPELDRNMAFKLAGKDSRLVRKDFLTLARTLELPIDRAETLITEMAVMLEKAPPRLQLPLIANRKARKEASLITEKVAAIVRTRAEAMR